MLGTNGGGFFNANSSHPFENPTPLTNLIEMLSMFLIPAGLTVTLGKMVGSRGHGWAVFAAMSVLWFAGVATCYWAEAQPNPLLHGVDQRVAQMGAAQSPAAIWRARRCASGLPNSTLFATVATDTSTGAVNSMEDSYMPLGGMVPLVNMMMGEVIFGGVGSGMYGMLILVIVTVFIAGLMVGRTPEYLGKKVQAYEVPAVHALRADLSLIILGFAAVSVLAPSFGTSSLANTGPMDCRKFCMHTPRQRRTMDRRLPG